MAQCSIDKIRKNSIINNINYHLGGNIIKNTVQKTAVLDALMRLDHPTADEIYADLHNDYPSVSRATIYRILNTMVDGGEILHLSMPKGPDRFDITLKNHQHFRCLNCGRTFDLDLSELDEIHKKIEDTTGFSVVRSSIVFEGLCPDCNNIASH